MGPNLFDWTFAPSHPQKFVGEFFLLIAGVSWEKFGGMFSGPTKQKLKDFGKFRNIFR